MKGIIERRLCLSTGAEAHVDGVAHALAPRDAALLAWLALEGPTPRTRLAALLWPDSDGDAARNALRQRLFQLRRQLGTELLAGSAALSLVPGVVHDLEASDLVLGDLAAVAAGEFATWLEMQRRRRRDRVRQSLAELAAMAETAGDWADALSHAQELLALEPLSEDAHRRVMRLHYLAGDRAAALLAFDRCEQVLKDEVGARPGAETLALLATVEAGVPLAASAAGAVLPASVQRPPRLIGRERELDLLAQGFRAGQVGALIGEAGLGKTRLLQAFIEGHPGVVRAAGRPGDAGVPFATLARLLRAVLALEGEAAPGSLTSASRGEIARVLPEFDGGGARPGGEGQRLVLQRALRHLLASQPRLDGLIVDDLHFADEASLEMIGALIDGNDAEPDRSPALRWMLAYRPAEAGSPVMALHDGLVEQARLAPIRLEPLSAQALAALVDSLGLPGVDGRGLAPGLHRRTGGNPLFVLETLKQAWVERSLGQLAELQTLPRPVSVGRLIERRVAQLSPPALALARIASIAGVDFGIGLAEQVLQVSAMQFADALNELEAAQVLRGTQFAHDLVHDAVRASVPATIAEHTHAQVAAWLERGQGEAARIAAHWIAAGQGKQALPWLAQAADAAWRALRAKESIAFLERKSEIEEATGATRAAFETLMRAAEQFADVELDAGRSASHCDRLDRLAATPAQRLEARMQRAMMHQQQGDADQALRIAEEVMPQAVLLGDPQVLAHCQMRLSVAYTLANRMAEALPHLQASGPWIAEHSGDAERSEYHGNMAVAYDNLGRLDDALPHHDLCFELAQRSGNLSQASLACGNRACNRIDAGDLEAADRFLQQGQALMSMYDGFGAHDGMLRMLRTLCLCHLGRYRDALQQAEIGLQVTRQYQPGYTDNAKLRLATCWWHLGQWARLLQLLDEVRLGDATSLTVRTHHARLRWAWASTGAADAKAVRLARDSLAQAIALIAPDDRPDLRLPLRIDLAAGLAPDEALIELTAVGEMAARLGHRGTELAALLRAAAVAAAVDPVRARRAAEAASVLARDRQTTALLPAERWLHVAQACHAAGATAQAQALLREGDAWLQRTAREQVPEAFRDSFLERHPVHLALRSLAAQLGAGG